MSVLTAAAETFRLRDTPVKVNRSFAAANAMSNLKRIITTADTTTGFTMGETVITVPTNTTTMTANNARGGNRDMPD